MPQGGVLKEPSRMYRSSPARGLAEGSKVERTGGDRGEGYIPGVSIIARGEALGHGQWIDGVMLDQVTEAINATGDKGLKVRFTHPSVSGDGLGKRLGRAKNARREGDRVYADVHISEVGHKTPDGDLADYVMTMAEQESDSFGVSIAFDPDYEAEHQFVLDNGGVIDPFWGMIEGFESPDKDNENNYPHARLASLVAADVVDDPAANPDGLFHRGDGVAFEADALVSYALGITDSVPTQPAGRFGLGVDPTRVRGFVARCLEQHGFELKEKTTMSDENTSNAADDAQDQTTDQGDQTTDTGTEEGNTDSTEGGTTDDDGGVPTVKDAFTGEELSRAELGAKFKEHFGDERGSRYFADGLSFEEALAADNKALREDVQKLQAKSNADAQSSDGVGFSADNGEKVKKVSAFEYSNRKNQTA